MAIDHGRLYIGKRRLLLQTFDGNNVAAIKLVNERDTRVDRFVIKGFRVGSRPTDQHGASPAIALGTSDFRAR